MKARWSLGWRSSLAGAIRVSRRINQTIRRTNIRHVAYIPNIDDSETLCDAQSRFNWYLSGAVETVRFGRAAEAVPAPPHQYLAPDLSHPPQGQRWGRTRHTDHLLIQKLTPWTFMRGFLSRAGASLVDPNFHHLEDSFSYLWVLAQSGKAGFSGSSEALHRLFAMAGARRALLLGTGPSASQLIGRDLDHDLRVVCNSAVRNEALLEHIRPQVIAFGDHVFHFGPNRYAAQFRADLVSAAERYDAILIVPDWAGPLIQLRLPELCERTICVSPRKLKSFRPLTVDDLSVQNTGNVLTQFMLPVGIALSDEVDIAGCDGRSTGEGYFWRHSSAVQYSSELMESAFLAHPAFFRDTSYTDYYARHCAQVDAICQLVEAGGKRIRSITESSIPALHSRTDLYD